MGYDGKDFKDTIKKEYEVELEVIKRPRRCGIWVRNDASLEDLPAAIERGFKVQPRRWVIERTFAWIGRNRRLSKEYDLLN